MGKVIPAILAVVMLLVGIFAGAGWVTKVETIDADTSQEYAIAYANEYKEFFSDSVISRIKKEMPTISLEELKKLNDKETLGIINPKRLMWNEIVCGSSRYLDGGEKWIAIVKTLTSNGLFIWFIVDCFTAQKRAVAYNDKAMTNYLDSFKK